MNKTNPPAATPKPNPGADLGWLASAIALLQTTAQKAATPEVVELENAAANPHETRMLMPDGTVQIFTLDVPVRCHTVYGIESLAPWATVIGEATAPPVWHCDEQVVLVLDDDKYRENQVTMPLPCPPPPGRQ